MLREASTSVSQQIRNDIECLIKLEGVSLYIVDRGFLSQGPEEEESEQSSIVFEASSGGNEAATACQLQVVITLSGCIHSVKRNRDTVITLGVEVPVEFPQGDIRVELIQISNAQKTFERTCINRLQAPSLEERSDSSEALGLRDRILSFYRYLQETVKQATVGSKREGNDGSLTPGEGNTSSHYCSDSSLSDESREILSSVTPSESVSLLSGRRHLDVYTGTRIESARLHKLLAMHSRYYREFDHQKVLGSGSFGCVTKVSRNGIAYALKQIPIYKNHGRTLHEEAAVLASLQHRYIVRYYDAWVEEPYDVIMSKFVGPEPRQGSHSLQFSYAGKNVHSPLFDSGSISLMGGFRVHSSLQRKIRLQNQVSREVNSHRNSKVRHVSSSRRKSKPVKYLFILMEYCAEDTLLNAVSDGRLLGKPQLAVELLRQILEALSYIHEKRIIHRDVKPSNIFLKSEDETLSIKLGDFGLTAKMRTDPSSMSTGVNPTGVVGTIHYMSPEQERGCPYDEKVDIFAAGVVFFEMLSPPFSTTMERSEVLSSFSTTEKKWPSEFQSRVETRVFKVLESMLSVDPTKRPSASQLLQSELFACFKLDTWTLYQVVSQYPHSMESTQLLASMFGRNETADSTFSYFNRLPDDSASSSYVNVELLRRYSQELGRRGAIRFEAPLFVVASADEDDPQSELEYHLLLNDGRTCQLRTCILSALAEYIPPVFLIVMRRWYWGKAYTRDPAGGHHPCESWRCAYNIIADYSILLQEIGSCSDALDTFFTAELIYTAVRPLIRFVPSSVTVEWTYEHFACRILEEGVGLHGRWLEGVRHLIVENAKRTNVMKQRLAEYLRAVSVPGFTSESLCSCVSQIAALLSTGVVSPVGDYMNSIARTLHSFGREVMQFNALARHLQSMERYLTLKDCEFVFVPLGFAPWHESKYTNFSFNVKYTVGKRVFDGLVGGGCINSLLPQRKGTIFGPPQRNAFGFEVILDPLISHFLQQEASILGKSGMVGLQCGYQLFPQVLICISIQDVVHRAVSLEHGMYKAGIVVEKQLGYPSSVRKLRKHISGGLLPLSRLEVLVIVKHWTGSSASGAATTETGKFEATYPPTDVQYKLIFVHTGNEMILWDEREVLNQVCQHVYRRYL
ncbi:Ser/Thr protein kinase, putative [Babesia bigemina]|uniref:Ser/Thr protein kinase, putative n=1 Tax=Babesia bigemina TaxID=5866 RepID=A0A061D4X8_BABBI|nr:Ser/Thr protein kinase, putative [Babesia bigemina]CDR94014.1 Ser/Thr protein kinase, putative [Babesia bigemina]|eukprot:XP_012766200.1 Ser/Thr protein kinase, putative [Babesia bigemina]